MSETDVNSTIPEVPAPDAPCETCSSMGAKVVAGVLAVIGLAAIWMAVSYITGRDPLRLAAAGE